VARVVRIAGALIAAAMGISSSEAFAQTAPTFQNTHVFAVIGPVTRSADGRRINVPFEFKSTKTAEDIYLGVAEAYKIGAVDNEGVRCGFGNRTDVAGIGTDVRRTEDATLITPGANLTAIFSMDCDPASKGDAFSVSVEVLVFLPKYKSVVRFSVGHQRVVVVGRAG
jgi:hypothetical protein